MKDREREDLLDKVTGKMNYNSCEKCGSRKWKIDVYKKPIPLSYETRIISVGVCKVCGNTKELGRVSI